MYPACCCYPWSHPTPWSFLPNFTTCFSPIIIALPSYPPYHGSSLNKAVMSDISLFSSLASPSLLSSPSSSSLFSPILSTSGTGRSHNGPHGGFSSGYGGCCPPVFNPGTLFALISGIALATYFLRPVCCPLFVFVFLFCIRLFNISSLESLSLSLTYFGSV